MVRGVIYVGDGALLELLISALFWPHLQLLLTNNPEYPVCNVLSVKNFQYLDKSTDECFRIAS